ncbi:MAG: Nif3-like dinuclear metal center hexameric protein [Christensenellales bacterium]|jgi:dinuclear metal center YbgI/SA1388 family protein
MRINDALKVIEEYAPLSYQEEYDNSGLIVGDRNAELTGILITLDITAKTVDEAVNAGANLIISHHPLIFHPIKYITTDDLRGEIIIKLIANGISAYAAHTNVDNTDENIALEFMSGLNVKDICPLADCYGMKASLVKPLQFIELIEIIKSHTGDNNIKSIGNLTDIVEEISVLNGAGGSDEEFIIRCGATSDVLITSELKHHIAILAAELDLAVIEIGHFESEKSFLELIHRKLTEKLDGIKIVKSEIKSPYN